jgi:hypothetical protein
MVGGAEEKGTQCDRKEREREDKAEESRKKRRAGMRCDAMLRSLPYMLTSLPLVSGVRTINPI